MPVRSGWMTVGLSTTPDVLLLMVSDSGSGSDIDCHIDFWIGSQKRFVYSVCFDSLDRMGNRDTATR